jgi:hypothetical protein
MEREPDSLGGRLLPAVFWALFAAGLLARLFSPHLTIEHNTFTLPPNSLLPGTAISPSDLVARERTVQLISVILTVAGAIGLAWWYLPRLFGRSSSRSETSP